MSTSPVFSAASLVDSSGMALITTRSTLAGLRQYPSKLSSTSSMPGLSDTNLYGPAPIGAFLNPSSPTFSTYFFGTIQPAPVAEVPEKAMKSGHGSFNTQRTRGGARS